jgi:hypothetical protein
MKKVNQKNINNKKKKKKEVQTNHVFGVHS